MRRRSELARSHAAAGNPAGEYSFTRRGVRMSASDRTRRERDPVDAYRSAIDVSLLDKNLGLSVEERFLQLMELQRFADELAAAAKDRAAMVELAALLERSAAR